ncbi:MAG: DUF2400 family protein [Candidatus Pacearchaeota archaeon]|nr:DUF2400 family protein [Candidatus Pacearchaeota archaeon]
MVNELSIIKIAVLGTISFAFAIALTPPLTSVLYRYRLWRKVSRDKAISGEELLYVPKFHGPEKLSIPRFGGLLIWLVPPAMALLFAATEPLGLSLNFLSRSQTWLPVATLFAASSVGFVDDLMQVLSRPIFPKLWRVLEDPRGGGLKLRYRLLLVFTIALVGAWWFSSKLGWDTIYIPGLGDLSLGLWYIPLFVFVMIATYSGGVIDGLDGLSGGAFATMFSAFAVISLAQGQADLAAFCLATQRILLAHGSLGAFFATGYAAGDPDVGPALERFVDGFLDQDLSAVFPRNRLSNGFRHLFPRPSTGGPCKRHHLFLRWMVRREPPDFGLWTAIPPSALMMPVDTHVEHMARALGLTRRRSRNWKMAEEITANLRALDPEDPVKYDFSLCHKRMSGDCLDRRDALVCAPCALQAVCRHWPTPRGADWRAAAGGEASGHGKSPSGARK